MDKLVQTLNLHISKLDSMSGRDVTFLTSRGFEAQLQIEGRKCCP